MPRQSKNGRDGSNAGEKKKARRFQSHVSPGPRERKRLIEHLEDRSLLAFLPNLQFPGPGQVNSIPPDPTAAAGPSNLLGGNRQAALYSKSNDLVDSAPLDAASGATNAFFKRVDKNFVAFDPWVFYDPYSNRFLAMAGEFEFGWPSFLRPRLNPLLNSHVPSND